MLLFASLLFFAVSARAPGVKDDVKKTNETELSQDISVSRDAFSVDNLNLYNESDVEISPGVMVPATQLSEGSIKVESYKQSYLAINNYNYSNQSVHIYDNNIKTLLSNEKDYTLNTGYRQVSKFQSDALLC